MWENPLHWKGWNCDRWPFNTARWIGGVTQLEGGCSLICNWNLADFKGGLDKRPNVNHVSFFRLTLCRGKTNKTCHWLKSYLTAIGGKIFSDRLIGEWGRISPEYLRSWLRAQRTNPSTHCRNVKCKFSRKRKSRLPLLAIGSVCLIDTLSNKQCVPV